MSAIRKALVGGSALIAVLAAAGCSTNGASKATSEPKGEPDVVAYEADYPSFDSIDEVIKKSDVIVRGTVMGSRVEEMRPEASTGGDPASDPQAGLSPEEAAEAEPVVVTVSTVKVSAVLSGDVAVGDTVEVSQLGGTLGGVTYRDKTTTFLAKGSTEYVLLLADHGSKAPYDLLNPEQALYTVKPGARVEPVSEGGFDNVGEVGRLAAKAEKIKKSDRR
ncbi:hypothetical protein OG883_29715 [Streptomyces sp. NBC_01142]|uniref:hypothetical protein n=1 Tax=Streptomyces sp. NBC_01142 TaxID=2975865 RepID=UPI002250031E|nr:hypothetical protein [Streptomyces sp. NBC_01142]MCX4823980.1 hypothetical protein [Streptomyces sp. NBC_01142]